MDELNERESGERLPALRTGALSSRLFDSVEEAGTYFAHSRIE